MHERRSAVKSACFSREAHLFDSLTVEENVMFPLNMFTEMTLEEKLERTNFCLKRVNLEM